MNFTAPAALWLLALLPLVVALHFLRARRRPLDVAALFLWRRAQAAVQRRRRFAPSWLLALQLLFVAAAAVGLAGPTADGASDDALVVVIDASASMAAASAPSAGTTRYDLATAAAQERIAGRSRVALVRAGSTPRLLLPIEATRSERLAALAAQRPADGSGDLLAAVDLGRSLLPGADVVVITDHAAELGRAEVVVVGEPVANLGISAFDALVGQAFVSVVASGRQPAEVTVGLYRAGAELARSTFLVPSGASGSVTFPLLEGQDGPLGVLEARIVSPQPDALPLDDVAFAGRRTLTVVTDDLYAPLLRALQAAPGVEVYSAVDATRRRADLRVVTRDFPDGAAGPDSLGPGNYLIFQPPAEAPEYHVVRDQDRSEPLMRFVELNDALVGLDPSAPDWSGDEGGGWTVLARADDLTPVLRLRRTEAGSVLQFAFHPSQSDVVLRPAFPALVANWILSLDATPRLGLGEALPGWPEAAMAPGVYDAATGGPLQGGGRAGAAASPAAPHPAASPAEASPVALASLLSAVESRLGAPPTGSAAGEGAVPERVAVSEAARQSGASSPEKAPTLIVTLLVAAALVALAAEWLLYSGRWGRRLVG